SIPLPLVTAHRGGADPKRPTFQPYTERRSGASGAARSKWRRFPARSRYGGPLFAWRSGLGQLVGGSFLKARRERVFPPRLEQWQIAPPMDVLSPPVAPPPTALSADAIQLPPLPRRVFCNRTLNLRSIQVVGCDMDYTLVHYDSERWEQSAYEYMKRAFEARGWPVHQLRFDPDLATLGLVIDVERGNLVKANRFGHVRNAAHGTAMLDFEAWRDAYGTAPIDLAEGRWQFMNTLFSLSEACLYMQLVDLLDLGRLEPGLSYRALYAEVRRALEATHLEGALKAEILSDPSRYVILDEELPRALWELKAAGKQLLLITNSEWSY